MRTVLLVAVTAGVVLLVAALMMTKYYQLAALVGPALLGGLVLSRFPWFGLFLILLVVPFDAFRDLGGPFAILSLSKITGILVLGMVFLLVVLGRIGLERASANLWMFILPFLILNIIASFFSDHPAVAMTSLRQLATAIIIFTLILMTIDRWQVLGGLTNLIILTVAASSALSVAGYLFDIPILAMGLDEVSLKRGTGGAKDPNVFALMVIFSVPLICYRIAQGGAPVMRMFWIGILGLSLVGIVVSQSRSGTMVAAATLVFLAWEHRHHINIRRLGIVMVLACIVAGAAVVAIPDSYWSRQASVANSEGDRSLGRRFSYLLVGWDAFKASPIIGHGTGVYTEIYMASDMAPKFVTSKDTNLRRRAHNTYIEVAIGSGLLGLACFAGFLVLMVRNFIVAARLYTRAGDEPGAALSRAFMWSTMSLLIYFVMISQLNQKYFWVAAGVSCILLRFAKSTAKAPSQAPATSPSLSKPNRPEVEPT